MKRYLLIALISVIHFGAHAGRMPASTSYQLLPANEVSKSQLHHRGMLALHSTLNLVQFYSALLTESDFPAIQSFKAENRIYKKILAELQAAEIQYAPNYVQRFAQKWVRQIKKQKQQQAPIGLERVEHLLAQLHYTEHFLATDIKLLNRYEPPRQIKSIYLTKVIVESGKELRNVVYNPKKRSLITKSVRSFTKPHMIGIFDAAVKAKNSPEALRLVASLSQSEKTDGVLEMEQKLRELVQLLEVQDEVEL